MHDVTQLLVAASAGDRLAMDRLMPLVYDELRRLGQAQLRGERSSHTLQGTALVHEAHLRLIDQKQVKWQNQAHLFGLASQMIRIRAASWNCGSSAVCRLRKQRREWTSAEAWLFREISR